MIKVTIVDYKLGNLYSLKNALKLVGLDPIISDDKEIILNSDCIILPGVGSFKEAMKNIESVGLDKSLIEFANSGKPFVGICLGMQLLFTSSDEFGLTKGLGLIPGSVKKIPEFYEGKERHVPNIGWYKMKYNFTDLPENREFFDIKDEQHMYFVHSYYVDPEEEITIAQTEINGFKFSSVIKKDNIFATQFHPEKSGEQGIKILRNIKNILMERITHE